MTGIRLDWTGPFSLNEDDERSLFRSEAGSTSGLYAWIIDTVHGPLAYYVGETGSTFSRRHREHLRSYGTGSYSVHSAASLSEGSQVAIYQGFVYSRRQRLLREPEFRERAVELAAELGRCFEVLAVYLAPLVVPQRVRRRVETALLDAILSARAHVRGFERERWSRWPRAASEPVLAVTLGPGLPLRSLPERFEA